VEVTPYHVDISIVARMECVKVDVIWKLLHSSWTVLL